jgi:preprotein translocase subunit SecE
VAIRESSMDKLIKYLQSSIEEMKKVTWPTRTETRNYTLMVIGISLGVAAVLGGLDFIFTMGINLVLNR